MEYYYYYYYYLAAPHGMRDQPGIKPVPPAVEAQS